MTAVFCTLIAADAYRPPPCGGMDPPVNVSTPDDLIHATTPGLIAAARTSVINYIWGTGGYPTSVPVETLGVVDPRFNNLLNLGSIDLLTFALPFAMTNYGWRLHPAAGATGRVVVMHAGHEQGPDAAEVRVVASMALRAGHTAIVLCMPFFGDSTSAWYAAVEYSFAINGPDVHRIFCEAAEPGYAATGYSVYRLFLDPLAMTLNMLASSGTTDVSAIGLSGGASTATIMAALDERILRSYPVSGSIPWYRRFAAGDWGDWENYQAELLNRMEWLDMYVMSCSGGRKQVQVLGWYDAIFVASHLADYRNYVAKAARLVGGVWDCRGDRTYVGHEVSPAAMAWILADIEANP